MAQIFKHHKDPFPPSAEQRQRMVETLRHHIGCLEKTGAGSSEAAARMTETLQRMVVCIDTDDEVTTAEPFDVSFSDTFSESFLCGAQSAADAVAATPTKPLYPQRRTLEKRGAPDQSLTPLHGIPRKINPPLNETKWQGGGYDSKMGESPETNLLDQLDESVDLFD